MDKPTRVGCPRYTWQGYDERPHRIRPTSFNTYPYLLEDGWNNLRYKCHSNIMLLRVLLAFFPYVTDRHNNPIHVRTVVAVRNVTFYCILGFQLYNKSPWNLFELPLGVRRATIPHYRQLYNIYMRLPLCWTIETNAKSTRLFTSRNADTLLFISSLTWSCVLFKTYTFRGHDKAITVGSKNGTHNEGQLPAAPHTNPHMPQNRDGDENK